LLEPDETFVIDPLDNLDFEENEFRGDLETEDEALPDESFVLDPFDNLFDGE
jgi:hypothetical protein